MMHFVYSSDIFGFVIVWSRDKTILTRVNAMSVSNPAEAELRELVAKTLEEKGVIGKVKVTELSRRSAHLRNSCVFYRLS